MTLLEKQATFAILVARLVLKANEMGYHLTYGEAWRSPEQMRINAQKGTGTLNSLHGERLAIDVNLYDSQWKYLALSEDHRLLGEWWEAQDPMCRWGGRFKSRPDGNHYSYSPDGVRA